jgi:hypothetical protein
MVIAANGIRDHNEFVKLIDERFKKVKIPLESSYKRKKAKYIGGVYLDPTEQ